jgi:hypothetical protein
MPPTMKVGAAADDKHGLTMGQLREFVQVAMRNDVPDEERVAATVTLGGKLKTISVTSPGTSPKIEGGTA